MPSGAFEPWMCEESCWSLCAWAVYHNFLQWNNTGQEEALLTLTHLLTLWGSCLSGKSLRPIKEEKKEPNSPSFFLFTFFMSSLNRILIGGSPFFSSVFCGVVGEISPVRYWCGIMDRTHPNSGISLCFFFFLLPLSLRGYGGPGEVKTLQNRAYKMNVNVKGRSPDPSLSRCLHFSASQSD